MIDIVFTLKQRIITKSKNIFRFKQLLNRKKKIISRYFIIDYTLRFMHTYARMTSKSPVEL